MKNVLETGGQAVCVALSLGGLAVAVWAVATGLPGTEGIDAMFLVVVGLAFALFFGAIPARALRRRQWKVRLRRAAKQEVRSDRSATA